MVVRNHLCLGQTLVPNTFIDRYLAAAGGDAVKVYIMLLRMSDAGTPTVSGLAESLDLTERAVARALDYWQKQGLIETEYTDGELSQITLVSPVVDEAPADAGNSAAAEAGAQAPAAKAAEAKAPEAAGTAGRSRASKTSGPEKKVDVNDLRFRQLLYVAEQFLGRTLTRTDTNFIVWLQEDMAFSPELTEYLLEYCVDKGHRNVSYMRAVAVGWKDAGVTDVESARAQTAGFDENTRRGAAKTGTNRFHNFSQRGTDLDALIINEIRERDGAQSAG